MISGNIVCMTFQLSIQLARINYLADGINRFYVPRFSDLERDCTRLCAAFMATIQLLGNY